MYRLTTKEQRVFDECAKALVRTQKSRPKSPSGRWVRDYNEKECSRILHNLTQLKLFKSRKI